MRLHWVILAIVVLACAWALMEGIQQARECREKGGLRVYGVCFDVRIIIP